MSVKKADNGTWMFDVRHPITKKRKRVKGFPTKGEADTARAILVEKWRNQKFGTNSNRVVKSIRLNLREELMTEAGLLLSETTDYFSANNRMMAYTARRFAEMIPGAMTVESLDTTLLEAFRDSERASGKKDNTLRTYLDHVQHILRRIQDRNAPRLDDWIIPRLRRQGKAGGGKLRRVWSADELDRVLLVLSNPKKYNNARRKDYRTDIAWLEAHDVILLAALTGARKTEIMLLEWERIHFEWNIAQVRTLKQQGENAVYREIPLSPELVEVLKRRRALVADDEPMVFPRWRDDQSGTWLYNVMRSACKVAGVEYGQKEFGVVPHGLRHSAATRMLANGVDINTAADVLGHSVLTMLQSYAHTSMDSKRRAMEAMSVRPKLRLVKKEAA